MWVEWSAISTGKKFLGANVHSNYECNNLKYQSFQVSHRLSLYIYIMMTEGWRTPGLKICIIVLHFGSDACRSNWDLYESILENVKLLQCMFSMLCTHMHTYIMYTLNNSYTHAYVLTFMFFRTPSLPYNPPYLARSSKDILKTEIVYKHMFSV